MYLVSLGSFDTHSNQVNADNLTGAHPNLLSQFSKAVKAFHEDLKFLSIDNRVVGMTFSEFGRRIKSNSSRGTDHGLASPMFVFGTGIKGGVIGANPVIPATVGTNDNVPMLHDYRQVYSTFLKDWFCAPAPEMSSVFSSTWPTLSFIQPAASNVCSPIALAIKDLTLEVEVLKNGDHALTWEVRNEKSVSHYLIQYSADGNQFKDVGKTFSNGDQAGSSEYQYIYVPANQRMHYYRIKCVYLDEGIFFSNVVKKQATISLSIYPVPAVDYVNLKMNQLDKNNAYDMRLISSTGAVVWQQKVRGDEFSASIYRIPVSSLVSGTYILQLNDQYNLNYSQRIQVIK